MRYSITIFFCLNCVSFSYAENNNESAYEEVIITSIKRSTKIVDVPISVSSISSETIETFSISNLEDLREYTNNLQITETGISTQVRIRGIGSGNNQGFEQSVGQYVDGVHYGRAQLFRAPYYDLDKVEVLKGAQNTLFGKSTIAGAINIQTAAPTSDFNSSLSVAHFFSTDETDISGYITGEISTNLFARFAFKYRESDGYLYNSSKGIDSPRIDDQSARLKLQWLASEQTTLDLKIEHSVFDREGRQFEIIKDEPSPLTLDLILGQPGNEDLIDIPSTFNNILVSLGQPSFESNPDFVRQSILDENSDNSISNISLRSSTFFDEIEFVNNLSFVNYESEELCDCEYVPADIFTLNLNESYDQFSLDSYVKNQDKSKTKYLFGVYLEKYDHKFQDIFSASETGVFGILNSPLAGTGARRNFKQESETLAIYGQVDFEIIDDISLIIEGRYSYEKKEANKSINLFLENGLNAGLDVACAYLIGLNTDSIQSEGLPNDCASSEPDLSQGISQGYNLSDSRTENVFTPSVSIVNKLNDYSTLYGSVKRGYKSGGFDVRSNNPESFEFENEESFAFEVGYKWDTNKSTNAFSLFHTTYKDLQVSQFDGSVGFNVGNASETNLLGFEFEGLYNITNYLNFNYGIGYINAEYQDFENGNCAQGEIPNGSDTNNDGISDLCDYTGRDLGFVSPLTANLGFQLDKNIYSNLEFLSAVNVQFIDESNVHPNMDPDGIQDAYSIINANISLNWKYWKLSLLALNLTDEHVVTYSANVPLSGSNFGTDTFYGFVKQGRRIGLELKRDF